MTEFRAYSTQDPDLGLIYVTDDDNPETPTIPDDKWKIRLIEQAFDRPEFDVEDV